MVFRELFVHFKVVDIDEASVPHAAVILADIDLEGFFVEHRDYLAGEIRFHLCVRLLDGKPGLVHAARLDRHHTDENQQQDTENQLVVELLQQIHLLAFTVVKFIKCEQKLCLE